VNEKVDIDSTDELRKVAKSHQVDGLFVGRLSGNVRGTRLLQVKFFGKDRDAFVLEKVKRIPSEGNLQKLVDALVADCVDTLTKK